MKPSTIQQAASEISGLAVKVCSAHSRGRNPFFVIGAGVSNAAGIPLMKGLINHLHSLVEAQGEREELAEIRSLLKLSTESHSRSSIALLFSALQQPDGGSDIVRGVWSQFCKDLIAGRIAGSVGAKAGSLLHRDPTFAHRWIASMCLDFNAQCLSLNFDGLTRAAIQQLLHERDRDERCVILDSHSKIARFFGRESLHTQLRGVMKLRGDIFFAICETSGCPLQNKETPVYELYRGSDSDRVGAPSLFCPECVKERKLQISFPSSHLKERETEDILAALGTYIVPTISAIIILGLSGEWDPALVDFVFTAAKTQNVPVIDVKLPPGSRDTHYIYDVWRTQYTDIDYVPLYGNADEFAEAMQRGLSASAGPVTATRISVPDLQPCDIDADHIWIEKRSETRSDLAAHIAKVQDVEKLRYYSQLGLKTLWWGGSENVAEHNRYHHSLGAMRVAEHWYDHLFPNSARPAEREFLSASMLLHDYGHLPFSHLFEEIFDELHWLPEVRGGRPWHEILTNQKIPELFTLTEPGTDYSFETYLSKLGYKPNDILSMIEGHTGRPYLDAMVNSAIDADKIDYIFRDIRFLQFGSSLPPDQKGWLKEFLTDQDLSPEGLIRLNGRSALLARELLETRRRLYLEFYLSPELRMMERMTSFILVCNLGRFIPIALANELKNLETALTGDHGPIKVRLASKRILEIYNKMLGDGAAPLREGPLILRLVKEVLEDSSSINPIVVDSLKLIQTRLRDFVENNDGESRGARVRRLYQELHVAGPYYADEQHSGVLAEIVRGLTLLHHGCLLIDVVKTPKFLATASARDFGKWGTNSTHVFGETLLVPDVDPLKWTVKSRARVPLHAVDFGALQQRHLQIVLFSPEGETPAARYVHEQFLRACGYGGVELNEKPQSPRGRP